MSVFRPLLGLAAAGFALAVSAHGYAYCLTRTCDPKSDMCQIVDGCNMSGKVLFWASSRVSFDVQKDGSVREGITATQLDDVVTNAFQRWVNADCGNGTTPSIELKDLGFVACAKPEYNTNQPNANIITFHDSAWPYSNAAVDTLALTTVFFDGDTGEIYDANVEINSNLDSFSVGTPTGDQVDLNAVITHELGHFLGLSHSSIQQATMYSMYSPDMTTLDTDDEQGICASLPPNRVASTDDYTPRHGWSGECAEPETGCCATAVGANASPRQTLGLWAFGLGLFAFGGRARLRRTRLARAPLR